MTTVITLAAYGALVYIVWRQFDMAQKEADRRHVSRPLGVVRCPWCEPRHGDAWCVECDGRGLVDLTPRGRR